MFRGKLGKVAPIKKIFDSLRGLIPEVRVLIKFDGVYFLGLDDKRLWLFKLFLDRKKFKSYIFDVPLAFCLKTLNVAKVLYLVSRNDIISIWAEESSPFFNIKWESEDNKKATIFNIRLKKDFGEDLQPPDVRFSSELTLRSYAFAKLTKQMKEMSDIVVISSWEEYVKFDIENDKWFGNFKIYTNKPPLPVSGNEEDEDQPANAKYKGELLSNLWFSTRFLHVIARVCSLSEEVTLRMSEDLPIQIEYRMPDYGVIQYYLQPKFSDYLYM